MHFDQLARKYEDPRTPADERYDMAVEIFDGRKGFLSGLKLPDQEEIRAGIAELDAWQEHWSPMTKAVQLQAGLPLRPIRKVQRGAHQSILYLNDMGLVGGLGEHSQYVERPGAGFDFLSHIYHHIDLPKAITNTFVRQVTAFCVPESDPSPLGFHFVRKDGEKITERDLPRIRKLEQWVLNCGDEADPRKRRRLRREDMRSYVAKLLTDSLVLDACPVETQMTSAKKLSGIYNIPGSSVRLCSEDGYEGDDEIIAVQLYQGNPAVAFSHEDIVYDVRNPRADLAAGGYGYSELEQMIKVLTGYYNAINFTHSGMDKNSAPRGFITVFGAYNQRAQADFERRLKTMLRGATNRFEIPILYVDPEESGGKAMPAAWTPIDKFDEMAFARWIVLQASIAGALYGMDPAEFHFDSFSVRNSSPLSSNDLADKIAHSKSKGREPLMRFVQSHYNQWIIPLVDDDYRLEWVGTQPEDDEKKHERIKLSSTVNELREMDGKDPITEDWGDAPVNPTLMGAYLGAQQGGSEMPGAGGGWGGNLDSEPPADDAPLTFQRPKQDAGKPQPMTKAETSPRRSGGLAVIVEREGE